ncbi:flavin reductase family protein [Ramlibacter sp.]|uniref:flavin reductase family protein n=1 Tax=Ramlibacter sp. TaxID=1917967 RepID=UPI003D0F86FB
MHLAAADLDADSTYRLLSGIVVPRPIAWVTTQSSTGLVNLAPFSCYTFVCNRPPMLGITFGRKAGVRKDSATHILDSREYVVNIGTFAQREQVHASSEEHPADVSETDLLGLATLPSQVVGVPRLADAPISMECRLRQVVPFGELGSEFFVGEVVSFHIREGLYRDGKIDTRELDPICRIGGPNYASLGEIVTLKHVAATPRGATAS